MSQKTTVLDVRCENCGETGIALSFCKHCGEFISITLALQEPPTSWTQNADSIDRLRRALAQIAAGTVPHREGNTTAEDYSEFAAEALEAKQ